MGIGCPFGNTLGRRPARPHGYFFGALSLGLLLLFELSLGFIVLSVPGALEVSVVAGTLPAMTVPRAVPSLPLGAPPRSRGPGDREGARAAG